MQNLGVGGPMLLIVIPLLIVLFKPSWIVKYFVIFGGFLLFFLIGMTLNDEGFRKELLEGKLEELSSSFLIFPLSFLCWYLISKIIERWRKKTKKGKKNNQ